LRTAKRALLCADGFNLAVKRYEVAGSLRRECETLGDLELVAIPNQRHLFTLLDARVTGGMIAKAIKPDGRTRWGERYRALTLTQAYLKRHGVPDAALLSRVHVELYLATAKNWGLMLAIRTGPHEFSRRLVSQIKAGKQHRVGGGYVRPWFPDGTKQSEIRKLPVIPCPDEETAFRLAGYDGVIEPKERC
jgi:DNA polymerase/3'-5' exonuclease PolX